MPLIMPLWPTPPEMDYLKPILFAGYKIGPAYISLFSERSKKDWKKKCIKGPWSTGGMCDPADP